MRTSISLLLAALLLGGCVSEPDEQASELTFRNLAPGVKYVGKDVCGTCHADKFETFVNAQMGRSFKPAIRAHSAAHWDNVSPIYDEQRDLFYQPFRRGDSLFVKEYRLADGDTLHKRVEKIDFIIGSGQHTNSHMMQVNGYFYQMPLTWYAQKRQWDLPPGFESNNSRFSRPITQACMGCHNAVSEYVPGSENRFTSIKHGIDCERCHGPGELHVAEKRAGILVDVRTEIDYSIVNPAKLPIERQFDVCQRCHMQGATVYKDGRGPYDFRPGMALASVLNVFSPRYSDSTSRFIMASHPDRLQMSECFLASHEPDSGFDPMTCTTCHDPHLPIEALGSDHYQSVCQSCHADASSSAIATASLHPPDTLADACTAPEAARIEKNNDCAACHMPKSGSADIPHVSITDHFIRVVKKPASAKPLTEEEFVGLASLIDKQPSHLNIAEGYMTYYEELMDVPYFLDSAAVHLERARQKYSPETVAPALVRFWFLQSDYDQIIDFTRAFDAMSVKDAWTHYRIGEAFSSVGDVQAAAVHFERAVDLEPEHLRFQNRTGMTYTALGRFEDAVSTFDMVLAANPLYDDAYNNRGFAHAMSGDFSAAEKDFLKAIDLNPDAFQAMANIASLYVNQSRREKARPYVDRLLAREPNNPGYRQLDRLVNGSRPPN